MAQVQKSIDPKKQYNFPKNIEVINYDSKIIVIAVDIGNWLILENENQLTFFNLLKNNTLEKSLELFKGEYNDAVQTVIQIEAKRFENQTVTKTDKSNKAMIYLTDGCNMRCPHCFMYAGCKTENELTCDEIIEFLTAFKKNGGNTVTFSGGEVTTRNDFSNIINRTFQLGIKIDVFTNGTLWTDEMINELSSKISEVQISIDGYNEEENARIRGKGNFEKALSTVDKFVNAGVSTRIAVTPFFDEKLESKKENFIEFANSLLLKYKDKKFSIRFSGELLKGRDVNLDKAENEKYKKIVEEIASKTIKIVGESIFVESHKKFNIFDNCNFGNMYVSSTGDIYTCSRLSELKPCANIRKDGFDKVLSISKKAKFLTNVDNLEPCNKCHLKYICGGGCRLVHFSNVPELGDFDSVKIAPRKCSKQEKEFFYDLMIKSNKDIFQ